MHPALARDIIQGAHAPIPEVWYNPGRKCTLPWPEIYSRTQVHPPPKYGTSQGANAPSLRLRYILERKCTHPRSMVQSRAQMHLVLVRDIIQGAHALIPEVWPEIYSKAQVHPTPKYGTIQGANAPSLGH